MAGTVLVVAAVAAYRNSFSGPFVFDDVPSIVDNPTIRHLWDLKVVLSPPSGGYTVAGRPVVNLSLAIDYAVSGLNVWSYHATNLLVHILAGLTLFGIVRRTLLRGQVSTRGIARRDATSRDLTPSLTSSVGPLPRWSELSSTRSSFGSSERVGDNSLHLSFTVALIWTLHPLQTESVTYIIQRAESLMGLFYFLTLYGFIRYVEEKAESEKRKAEVESRNSEGGNLQKSGKANRERGSRFPLSAFRFPLLSFVACFLGMATKEVMVSAPIIVLLYDRCFVSGSFRAALRRRGYYAALALTWIALVFLALGNRTRGETAGADAGMSVTGYWLTQFHAIAHYLALVFWPRHLVLDYGTDLAPTIASVLPSIVLVFLLMIGTGYFLVRPSRDQGRDFGGRALGFCGFLFFAVLAPTSLIPVVVQVMAEHRMYLALAPVVAVAVAGGYSLLALLSAKSRGAGLATRIHLTVCLAAAAGLGLATARRNQDYRSELALWSGTATQSPTNARAIYNLGMALEQAGNRSAAMDRFREALRLSPDYTEARTNLGIALTEEGEWPEAIAEYEEAARRDPYSGKTRYNLGNALLHVGNIPDAISSYEEARRLSPDNPDIEFNLGLALAKAGRGDEAIAAYEQALLLKPDFAKARNNLGNAYYNRATDLARGGRYEDAIGFYESAIRVRPDFPDAQNDLALALTQLGRIPEALPHFREVVRLQPDFAEAHENLATALARLGQVAQAADEFRAAAALQPKNPEIHNNLGCTLAELGRTEEARKEFEQALRLAPEDAEARANLARLPAAP